MALPRNSWWVLVVTLVAGVTSLALADPPEQQQQDVTITLNANNTITVSPDTVRVQRGNPIRWSGNAPFAVVVERHTSVFPTSLPPQAMRGRANAPLQAQTRGNATLGTYKYTVIVWDANDDQQRIEDPEIVVLGP